MRDENKLHVETLAVHAGYESNNNYGDIVQPLHLSTTFQRDEENNYREFSYSRAGNPNRDALEKKLAAIEGAAEAITFSSGMAAINALFENVLQPGAHVIIPDDCYHGTRNLLQNFFIRWQVSFSEVDMTDANNIASAINNNTKLIWIETPSNPQLKITDIAAVVKLAKQKHIFTACDNTFATPLLQKPLDMDVDFVMHSSTKFFSGHSDIIGGCIMIKQTSETGERIRNYQKAAGAVPSPFDCWLLNRSLSTLALRVRVQSGNGAALAAFFSSHAKVEKVFYPGLATHHNHHIAALQMPNGFGSLLSVLIKGDAKNAMQFAAKLNIIKHATSLGGVESLIEHRRTAEGNHPVSPDNLLRISTGIEHIDDLLYDCKEALDLI